MGYFMATHRSIGNDARRRQRTFAPSLHSPCPGGHCPYLQRQGIHICQVKSAGSRQCVEKIRVRVIVDDRDEYTSGWKFNEWEIKGVPLRINLGPRDIKNAELELVRRDTMLKWTTKESDVVDSVTSILDEIQTNLLNRAKEIQRQYISRTNSYDTFKSILDAKGGFIYTHWCGEQSCEIKIKEETGADLRVIPFECKEDQVTNLCIYCGEPSNKIAIFGRAY